MRSPRGRASFLKTTTSPALIFTDRPGHVNPPVVEGSGVDRGDRRVVMERAAAVCEESSPRAYGFMGDHHASTGAPESELARPVGSHVRYKVVAIAVALAGITYLDRVCIAQTAPL